MKLIVGLGNPGEKYQATKHNLGFVVLDGLLQKLEPVDKTVWRKDSKSNNLIFKTKELILAKPQTMMNASGFAVQKLSDYYKIKPKDIWVVHDDVDLILGKFKIRLGGAAAGHRGVESIIEKLGTDKFVRFRLGIGRPGRGEPGVDDYVLQEFDSNQASEVKQLIKKAIEAIQYALEESLEKAMNRYNQ